MKRTVILFIIAALVLITTGIWYFNTLNKTDLLELSSIAVIVLVVVFALFLGFKRIRSLKRNEPTEDELSKKILMKSASLSYYISIYLWLCIMYLSDKTKLENHSLIGIGILGMAIIFALCWIFVYLRGIKND